MATIEAGVRAIVGFASKTGLRKANEDFAGALLGSELPQPRQEVIAATPALHERELSKLEALSDALTLALQARGVPDLPAALAARAGMAAFAHATLLWLEKDQPSLGERLDLAEGALKSLL